MREPSLRELAYGLFRARWRRYTCRARQRGIAASLL